MANKLLLCVDLPEADGHVVDFAVRLAEDLGAAIEVLHIVAPEPDFVGYTSFVYPGRDEQAHELRREKAALSELAERLKAEGAQVSAYMKEAPTVDGILEFAHHHEIRMIVIGSHSKGAISTFLLGSVAKELVKRADIPVLVVPPPKAQSET